VLELDMSKLTNESSNHNAFAMRGR
jgi:hypothetical protein